MSNFCGPPRLDGLVEAGDPTGNRTPVSGVRGQRPNR